MPKILSLRFQQLFLTFKTAEKNFEKIFSFRDNWIWIGCVTLSLLRREYLLLAVNVLPKSLQALYITKGDLFQLNCLHSDQQICSTCCRSDFNSVCVQLPRCFSKGALKKDFLNIYLITFFRVRNFRNTSAIRVIFFLRIFKIWAKFQNWKKNLEVFFCLRNNCVWIASIKLSLLRGEYLSLAVNALTRVLRLCISLRENFSNSIAFRVINKYA